MEGLPLHPALVHLPLGLSAVIPLLAIGFAWAILGARLPRRSWVVIVALQALLLASGVVAMRTGEAEEDRVERVVTKARIEHHEHAAERMVWASAATLALALAGLKLKEGAAHRAVLVSTSVASLVVAGLAAYAGHEGGELVYVHGAAAAYTTAGQVDPLSSAQAPRPATEGDSD